MFSVKVSLHILSFDLENFNYVDELKYGLFAVVCGCGRTWRDRSGG